MDPDKGKKKSKEKREGGNSKAQEIRRGKGEGICKGLGKSKTEIGKESEAPYKTSALTSKKRRRGRPKSGQVIGDEKITSNPSRKLAMTPEKRTLGVKLGSIKRVRAKRRIREGLCKQFTGLLEECGDVRFWGEKGGKSGRSRNQRESPPHSVGGGGVRGRKSAVQRATEQ